MTSQLDLNHRIQNVRLAIFDVDGVLTDGGLFRTDDGQEIKRFHSRDGLGLRLLQNSGVQLAIITGRTSHVVEHRAKELGITHLYQGCKQKVPAFLEICKQLSVTPEQTAYMGDDLIDLPVMIRCGLALTVAEAHPEVVKRAHWVSQYKGGNGAAREACELIMKQQGSWQEVLEGYLA